MRSTSESKMLLLEEYSELIERDSAEISFLWKGLQMLACLLSILSGYSCAILFYMLWVFLFYNVFRRLKIFNMFIERYLLPSGEYF